jgi:hypothetical protein
VIIAAGGHVKMPNNTFAVERKKARPLKSDVSNQENLCLMMPF